MSPTPLRRLVRLAPALALAFAPLGAQGRPAAPATPAAPPGWTILTDAGGHDHGDGAKVSFVRMAPGYHVTTGPAAILYDGAVRASGDWRLEATLHLFDPGGRAEGFGVFFGGQGLGSASQKYGYALVRRDGKAMLKVRDGATTRTVRDWTANAAVPVWRGTGARSSVRYPLVVEARGDRVTLSVAGTVVLDAKRSELPTDGIVGLRVNHALDLHVENIKVTPIAKS
jgi:hypothetical protein